MVRHVWQACVNDIALVLEPDLLHNPLRHPIGGQGKANHFCHAKFRESHRQYRLSHLRRQSPTPILGHECVDQFHFIAGAYVSIVQASTPDKPIIRFVSKHPESTSVTCPMIQMSAKKMPCLLVGEDANVGRTHGRKSRHDLRITVHLAKIVEMLGV